MKDGEVGIEELLAAVTGIEGGSECEPVADYAVRILGEGILGRVSATITHDDSDTHNASSGPVPAPLCSTVPIHGLPPSFSPFDSDAAVRNTLLERYTRPNRQVQSPQRCLLFSPAFTHPHPRFVSRSTHILTYRLVDPR